MSWRPTKSTWSMSGSVSVGLGIKRVYKSMKLTGY